MNTQGNGSATLWGTVTQIVQDKANETVEAVATATVSQTLEQKRKAKGQSKFKFYGNFLLSWLKQHWWWFLLPTALILLYLAISWAASKIKNRKSKKRW